MTATRRQWMTLAGLAVLLAVAAWWGLREPAAPVGRGAQARPGAARAGASAGPTDVPAVHRIARDESEAGAEESGRDPFRFGAARRDEPGGPGGAAAAGRGAAAPSLPAPPVSTEPSGPPPPPPIPLKLIGLVRQEGLLGRIAVLSDARGVYHGREGDLIEGRYRVLRISGDTVDVAYADGRGRQTLRLSGS